MSIPQSALCSLRPPLKWAGGKRWLVPHLRPLWKPYQDRRLVEPFCGGLAVTLGLRPGRALLNDINVHLINFFRWLQRGLHISLTMENDEELYYAHRDQFNMLVAEGRIDSQESAELFYYLNRTGYNGLCRFNQQGFFNVPFGKYRRSTTPGLLPYRKVFANWILHAATLGSCVEPSDFVCADPPYDVEFTQYASAGFTWQDQVRLAQWLASHPGPVVLSNQATPRIIELYRDYGFRLRFLRGPRMISCSGDRTPALEVLAFRNLSQPM